MNTNTIELNPNTMELNLDEMEQICGGRWSWKQAIIGGVIRGGDSFIAVGHTHIEPYDRVAVFALPEAVKEVDKMFR